MSDHTPAAVAVIGLGLMGSGTLRHLAEAADGAGTVIGIGPAEPTGPGWNGPFASWFDSGRITRRLDARREWAILASRAIDAYPGLEAATGIDFHRHAGLVYVRNDASGIAAQHAVIDEFGLTVSIGTTDKDFADYGFPAGWTTLHESAPAGHIDPRQMRRAELAAATSAGAVVHETWVVGLERVGGIWRVELASGPAVEAQRVVISGGAYANTLMAMAGLEPLELAVRPEAVVLGEVDDATVEALASMPSIIYLPDTGPLDDVYVVPPVQYPDGRWIVKMGGALAGVERFVPGPEGDAATQRWMDSLAVDDQLDMMRDVLQGVLPFVDFVSWQVKPCLISDTSSGLPYIDRVDEGLFVCVGGNGHSAKSADAIGAVGAAMVVAGEWADPELDAATFAARFGVWTPGEGSRLG